MFVLLDHPDLFLLKVELDVFEDLDFVLCEVGVLLEDFQVEELEEFRLEHEGVVSNTDEAQGVEGVWLDLTPLVAHEVEHALENLLNRPALVLKRTTTKGLLPR